MENFDYNTISESYYDEVFNRKDGIQSAWHHIKFNLGFLLFVKIKKNISR